MNFFSFLKEKIFSLYKKITPSSKEKMTPLEEQQEELKDQQEEEKKSAFQSLQKSISSPPYPVVTVANEFIRLSRDYGGITSSALQKMLYFSQTLHLLENEHHLPLIDEDFVIWNLGPVLPPLVLQLKHHLGKPVLDELSPNSYQPVLEESSAHLIRDIYFHFMNLPLNELAKLIKSEDNMFGYAWNEKRKKDGEHSILTHQELLHYAQEFEKNDVNSTSIPVPQS